MNAPLPPGTPANQPPSPPPPPGAATPRLDEATRLLAAAAHGNERFADAVLTEFLAEPRRAVPPSPGVDAAAVLAEALAVRGRRVVRDAIALALFVVIMVLGWPTSLFWPAAVASWVLVHSMVRAKVREQGRRRLGAGAWLAVAVGAALVLSMGYALLNLVLTGGESLAGSSGRYGGYGDYEPYPDDGASSLFGPLGGLFSVLAGLALLVLLAADQLLVRQALTAWVGHTGTGQPGGPPAVGANWLTGASPTGAPGSYQARLAQLRHSAEQGNLIVHDGYNAFVGFGQLMHSWSLAVHLRRDNADATARPGGSDDDRIQLDVNEIHQAVASEVLRLRDSQSLSPGFRLRELTATEQVIVSSAALLRHRDTDPLAGAILPDLSWPPRVQLTDREVREIASGSREWIRAYRCYRVDSWDRDLVVSAFLHIGCGDGVLYLEWNSFQLNPIGPRQRIQLWDLVGPGRSLWTAVVKTVGLPASLAARLRTLATLLSERVQLGHQRTTPDVYGARRSIREIAAGVEPDTYFQDVDGVRYLKLLEQRTLTAVQHFLARSGLSVEEFERQSNQVINNTVINGGQFTGTNVIGQGNDVAAGNNSPGQIPNRDNNTRGSNHNRTEQR